MRHMRVLNVFDSAYGNTERIARAIGAALEPEGTVAVTRAADVRTTDLAVLDLLIVGGPTQRYRASPALAAWLERLGRRTLSGVPAAAFDTRYRMSAFLTGSAARVIALRLGRAGCRLVAAPESFFIERDRRPPARSAATISSGSRSARPSARPPGRSDSCGRWTSGQAAAAPSSRARLDANPTRSVDRGLHDGRP
jgi:flavodoxin